MQVGFLLRGLGLRCVMAHLFFVRFCLLMDDLNCWKYRFVNL